MSDVLEPSILRALGITLAERTGLRFGANRCADLDRAVRASWRQLELASPRQCATLFVSGAATRRQLRVLVSHLTVGETDFFREKAAFDLIQNQILPSLISSRRGNSQRVRAWSAGCCTGEEIYSVAILLDQMLPAPREWLIDLLATDINEHYLHVGAEGVYSDWSFREGPRDVRERFFTPHHGGRFRIASRLRRAVTFSPLNLCEDPYPCPGTEKMDLILCRNVLLYMEEKQAYKIVQNLGRCLAEGGWLLVGAAEGSLVRHEHLEPAGISGVMAFRKFQKAIQAIHPTGIDFPFEIDVPASVAQATSTSGHGPADFDEPPSARQIFHHEADVVTGAAAAFERQDYAEAVARLLPVCGAGCVSAKALELLARAYANQGNHELAMLWCKRSISVDKLDARLHYLMASILAERREPAEAAAAFRRAIYLNPDFVMAHVGAGHLAARQGKSGDCQRHFETARQLLERYRADEPVSEAEGISARELARLIETQPRHARPA